MADSLIDVFHGFGNIIGKVSHDGQTGNAVGSFFEAEFIEGECPHIELEHDADEVGHVRKNRETNEDFLAIKLEHFERIEKNEDLGKLYTHRLPRLDQNSKDIQVTDLEYLR